MVNQATLQYLDPVVQRDGKDDELAICGVPFSVYGERDKRDRGRGKRLNKRTSPNLVFCRFMSNPRVTLIALKPFSFEQTLFFRQLIFRK